MLSFFPSLLSNLCFRTRHFNSSSTSSSLSLNKSSILKKASNGALSNSLTIKIVLTLLRRRVSQYSLLLMTNASFLKVLFISFLFAYIRSEITYLNMMYVGSDQNFATKMYTSMTALHPKRFSATQAQKFAFKFGITHYAGLVVYSSDLFMVLF